MNKLSLPLTRFVHENLSIVMCFAYSQEPLSEMVAKTFSGEWKYLHRALFEISTERAEKACLELALFLRMIDEEEMIAKSNSLRMHGPDFGKLLMEDGSERVLTLRDVSNKIIHSKTREWNLSAKPPSPFLICHTGDDGKRLPPEMRWIRAEIDLEAVAAECGQLMS